MKKYIAAGAMAFFLSVPSLVYAQVVPQQGSSSSSNNPSADTHGGGSGQSSGGGILGGLFGGGNGGGQSGNFDYRLSCYWFTQNSTAPTVDSCRQMTSKPSSSPY
ncbi:MAG: hypothetical protein KGL10_01760 [Alphaproteobacteria bacterium]|nr:hypothetical protein [Alphaproteobacteria bacterium]